MNELLRTHGLNWVEFFSWTSVRESYEYTLYLHLFQSHMVVDYPYPATL